MIRKKLTHYCVTIEHADALCNCVEGCKDSPTKCMRHNKPPYSCFAWKEVDPFKYKLLEIKYRSKNDKQRTP